MLLHGALHTEYTWWVYTSVRRISALLDCAYYYHYYSIIRSTTLFFKPTSPDLRWLETQRLWAQVLTFRYKPIRRPQVRENTAKYELRSSHFRYKLGDHRWGETQQNMSSGPHIYGLVPPNADASAMHSRSRERIVKGSPMSWRCIADVVTMCSQCFCKEI